MKKILTIFAVALCIVAASCGRSLTKEEVMKKVEDGKELTSEDYSVLISSLEDEYNQFLKILDKNPMEYTDEDTGIIQEIFTTSLIVSQGKLDGKLGEEEINKLNKIEARIQSELEKQKSKIPQNALKEVEEIEESL